MRLAVSLLACLSFTANAAPFAVQLGDVRVALDAPPGFADTTETGSPRLQELAESLTSASNRVLMFAVTDADMRRFTVGDQLEAKRYAIVVSPRGLERDFITVKAFSTFVGDSLRELGNLPPAGTGAADYPRYLDSTQGRPTLLAELRRDPQVVSVLLGARLPSINGKSDAPKYMLTTTTLILLRGKALNVGVFSNYDSPADLEWIRITTARWVEELQRLNAR